MKMGHLIDDLLDFYRTGKQELVKVDIDTKAMVGEIIDELKEQGRIHWNIRELIPVKADVNTIRQVWINLLSQRGQIQRSYKNDPV